MVWTDLCGSISYINSNLDQKGVGRYKGGWYVIGQLGLLGTAGCAVYETIAAA